MPLNILARNNKIGLWNYLIGLSYEAMVNSNGDAWGYSYHDVRGESRMVAVW